eukprot:snap_masked-scaffold_15-processed-gene-0.0-mRNA-1 protein AED:1.00 eAED:1.00 QI:0/0/0/0/1/1/2/0/120
MVQVVAEGTGRDERVARTIPKITWKKTSTVGIRIREWVEPAALPPIVEHTRKGQRILISIDDDVLYKLSNSFSKRMEEYEKNVSKYVELQKVKNNNRCRCTVNAVVLQYGLDGWCLGLSR